ncbi:hypothetical protein CLAFUW4_13439 [Fulvia fulva]|uniref:Uncharacterized protein n=1 Tax=Passalora fulva TaxID=5499 RepID=A0A9Q8PKG6_PASFU|nr:uncharacterized protein CLAFUR5_13293 [Fulvia fulva]KAK4611843.1 hypothetical protein CLAFUR4_13442 [Fulvia fulva]KAK4612957.1 hypothetical protein CLAFUR0_13450 [Fulvia fulva]UJO24091.1 hypothetical protein CLAFUR5_13293 [Fulvia fulva]WPV21682.1 hypothetical protein CLAFUW4_13439 [Fulvia fulva]WPV35769.1 hypothetical protein CLAFUW7_13446 [Fulvia fulva]
MKLITLAAAAALGATATTGQETTFSGAEAHNIAHTNAANAVFNICDISSEPDTVELLVNVDFSVAIPSCAYTPPIVNGGVAWSCNGNGKGGNLLKFTVKNTGTVVAVRDAAVSDVLRSYGDAISTHDVGGVKGKGFCDASYPFPPRVAQRIPAGKADFQSCDITSVAGQNKGKSNILFNVDIGRPFNGGSGCNWNRARISSLGGWSCKDNGSGGTSLKFTTERKGSTTAVRDGAVSEVQNAYGSAITSKNVGGIAGHGSCKLTYPTRKIMRRNINNSVMTDLVKRVDNGQAIIKACDIGSDSGKTQLLFNIEVGVPFPTDSETSDLYCEHILKAVNNISRWRCENNGVGYTAIKFATERDDTVVAVRDQVMAEVQEAYGGVVTTHFESGVKGEGFCDLVCDQTLTSDELNGLREVIFLVDIELPWQDGQGCNHIHDRIYGIHQWRCFQTPGRDATTLHFSTRYGDTAENMRGQGVIDVYNAYGGAILVSKVPAAIGDDNDCVPF